MTHHKQWVYLHYTVDEQAVTIMNRSTLKVLHAGKNYKPFVKKTRKQVREENGV